MSIIVFYIRKNNLPTEVSINQYLLQVGAHLLGEEVVLFDSFFEISYLKKEDFVADYLYETRKLLSLMGIQIPYFDYPPQLASYYGRSIKAGVLGQIVNDPLSWGKFIKPRAENKRFTGRLVNGTKDLMGISLPFDYPIWISDPVIFLSEWRCFVLHHRVLDVRPYKGDYHYTYNPQVIDEAVKAWKDAPQAYAIDIGVTSDGETLIVEVNDGFALGKYGLDPLKVVAFQRARWLELTKPYFKKEDYFFLPAPDENPF